MSTAAMPKAARNGDIGAFRDTDLAFHRRVCTACGNSFLLRLCRTIESCRMRAARLHSPFNNNIGESGEKGG
ncbi:FCD domain-containing protein [Nonomuraea jiangxiensis]|uniref:FCD domain-containing protein n=2 Tax=Nonomuraea jiangxiensis TaxID=633440 RepID=A0A1G7ZJ17_9ACTN|nr:FCD domain-containing protein [Nonomuraea jiangxiensis]